MLKYLDYRNTLGFVACGAEWAVFAVIWPLFVILIIKGYFVIGILASVPLMINVFSIFFISRIEDKKGASKVIKFGSFFVFINWFVRIFITKAWQIFGISIFQGIEDPMTKVGLDTICYDRAKKAHVVEAIAGREFALNLGRILLFAVLIIFPSFTLAFILASASSIFYFIFALKSKKEIQKVSWLKKKEK